jgi:hypothetical protein
MFASQACLCGGVVTVTIHEIEPAYIRQLIVRSEELRQITRKLIAKAEILHAESREHARELYRGRRETDRSDWKAGES